MSPLIWNDWEFGSTHFVIKNWHNDVYVGYDGSLKSKNMAEFLTFETILVEQHKKMFEEWDLFEKDSSFTFMWSHFQFQVLISQCFLFNILVSIVCVNNLTLLLS